MDYKSDQQNTNQEPQLDGSENLRQLIEYYQKKGRQRPDGATQPKGGTYQWFLLIGLIVLPLGFWLVGTDSFQDFREGFEEGFAQQRNIEENSQDDSELTVADDEFTPHEQVVAAMAGITFDVIWYHHEADVALLSDENLQAVINSSAYRTYQHPSLDQPYSLTTTDPPAEGVLRLASGFCPDEEPFSNNDFIHATTITPDGEPYCYPIEVFNAADLQI